MDETDPYASIKTNLGVHFCANKCPSEIVKWWYDNELSENDYTIITSISEFQIITVKLLTKPQHSTSIGWVRGHVWRSSTFTSLATEYENSIILWMEIKLTWWAAAPRSSVRNDNTAAVFTAELSLNIRDLVSCQAPSRFFSCAFSNYLLNLLRALEAFYIALGHVNLVRN